MKKYLENPKADWVKNGIILGGMYEGLMFPRRRGEFSGTRLHHNYMDAEERFKKSFSPGFAEQLQQEGISMMILNFHKGLGWEAEKEERELMRNMSQHCREKGIGVAVYIGDTHFPETFFLEHPEGEDWCCRDINGRPQHYDGQPFRRLGCLNNPGWLAYLHEVARRAVIDYKVDFVHFDNFMLRKNFCHCKHCTEKFRKWLKDTFTPEKRRELFGFSQLEQVFPPDQNSAGADPMVIAYRKFRVASLTAAFRCLSEAVRSWNPACMVELNCQSLSLPGLSEHGVDHPEILRYADAFWDEASPFPRYHSDITRIRSYRLAEICNAQVLCYNTLTDLHPVMEDTDDKLLLGEAMAFGNACLGSIFFVYFSDQCKISGNTRRSIAFFRKYAAAFRRKSRTVSTALLYGKDTQLLDYKKFNAGITPVETALQKGHVSWKMVFDNDIDSLTEEMTLIVSGQYFISAELRSQLLKFIQRGGELILCGENGVQDEWMRHYPISLNDDPEFISQNNVRLCTPDQLAEFLPHTALAPETLWVEPVETEMGEIVHLLNYDPEKPAEIMLNCAGKAILYSPDAEPQEIDPAHFTFNGTYGFVKIITK